MGLFTKVFSLIIAQIILMVVCVYIHLDTFMPKKTQTDTPETIITTEKNISELLEQKAEADLTIIENPPVEEVLSNIEESTDMETTPVEKIPEVILEDSVQNEEVLDTEPVPSIEEKEVVKTPQITDQKVKALFDKKKVQVKQEPQTEQTTNPIEYEKIEQDIAQLLKENRIIFKRLSTDVADESKITVERIAEILKQYPQVNIEVGGHTDAKGDKEVNEYISKHRALSVKNLLVEYGVEKERLSAVGYGESRPIVENDPQGYSILNRRVEFKVIKD